MSTIKMLALGCLLALGGAVYAQEADTTKPCSSPEASQFDFWVGEWELTWADTGKGTNIVTEPLGQCVIEEQFADAAANSLKGMSVSVYNPRTKEWQQTWVDNMGGYMVFTGGWQGDRMILSRETVRPDGTPVIQRMVWRDITPNSLTWDWQASEDKGATWKTNWQISYVRKQ